VKFYIYSCFLAQVWLFCLLQCFSAETDETKFCSVWKYCIPSCMPHWQIHKQISTERALQCWSSMTAHVFRPGLTLRPTTMFCWCHWWKKVSKHMKLLHPLLHSPLADPQTNLYRERALPHTSSVYNHGFFFKKRSASCAAELELSSKWGNFKED